MCAYVHLMLVFYAQKSFSSIVAMRRGNITCSLRILLEVSRRKQLKIQYTEILRFQQSGSEQRYVLHQMQSEGIAQQLASSFLPDSGQFHLFSCSCPTSFRFPSPSPRRCHSPFNVKIHKVESLNAKKALKGQQRYNFFKPQTEKEEILGGGTLPGPADRNHNCHAEEG